MASAPCAVQSSVVPGLGVHRRDRQLCAAEFRLALNGGTMSPHGNQRIFGYKHRSWRCYHVETFITSRLIRGLRFPRQGEPILIVTR